MHKVSTANAVTEPGRVERWGVGKLAAQFQAFPWLWLAAPAGKAPAGNPNLNPA
jgi:hypothetical protein